MADTKISALTADGTPDRTADYGPTYDASVVATKKVLLKDYGAYTIQFSSTNNTPADNTTYYFAAPTGGTFGNTAGSRKIWIPRTGKVLAAYILFTCVAGSAETSSIYFRLNNTTDTLISNAVNLSASPAEVSKTDLSIAVTAGDYFEIKWTTPNPWATNPTSVTISGIVYVA